MPDEEFLLEIKNIGISKEFVVQLALLEKIYRDTFWV